MVHCSNTWGWSPRKGETQMAKAKTVRQVRTYKVVSADDASRFGLVHGNDPFKRYALIAVRGENLDTMISWGFNSENLQKIADARNKDIAMLGKMVGKANEIADIEEQE